MYFTTFTYNLPTYPFFVFKYLKTDRVVPLPTVPHLPKKKVNVESVMQENTAGFKRNL